MDTLHLVVLFGLLLAGLRAGPSFVLSKQKGLAQVAGGHDSGVPQQSTNDERPQIKSVTVRCYPDSLEVMIQADLFGVGASVKSSDLRLGVNNDQRCKAILTSDDEYTITAGLLDCGTKHWMTEDSLVYTNLLIYSPEPSAGVIRMEEAVIPIECHYERKYSLSSSALLPTWIPFVSTKATMEKLSLALKVMTPDWLYKRNSNVFYLGESINIEASVRSGHHIGLRVFLTSCVATLTPDETSSPRYVFIEDGCLLDSQAPNSRSQFLSRVQDDKLHLVLDAFRFHNENRGQIYITCQMTAVPVNNADSPNKACNFNNGRWRSADGNDYLCGYCQTQNEENIQEKLGSQFSPRKFGRLTKPEIFWRSGLKSNKERDNEATLGPLMVLPVEKKTAQNLNSVYGSTWRSGVPRSTVEKAFVPVSNLKNDAEEIPDPEEEIAPNVTKGKDDAGENETSNKDAEPGFETSSQKMDPNKRFKTKDIWDNETTPSPSDVVTTLLQTIETASLNNTNNSM